MPSFFGLEIPPNRPIRFRPDVATTVVVCQAALGPLDHPSSSSDGETTAARSSASIFVQTTSDGPEDTTPPPNKKLSIGTLRAETCEQFSFGTGLTFASGETVTVTHTGKGRSVYLSGRIEEDDDFDGEEDASSDSSDDSSSSDEEEEEDEDEEESDGEEDFMKRAALLAKAAAKAREEEEGLERHGCRRLLGQR